MKLLLVVVVASLAITCARDDGQPDPPTQVLVECDPHEPLGAPLACPPPAIDAGVDAPHD
jgi:hypothetical protein